MIGSLLAGTDESPGFIVLRDGSRYKLYRAWPRSPPASSRKRKAGTAERDLDPVDVAEVVPGGGVHGAPTAATCARSSISWPAACVLEHELLRRPHFAELWGKAEFMRISPASWQESRPHALDK